VPVRMGAVVLARRGCFSVLSVQMLVCLGGLWVRHESERTDCSACQDLRTRTFAPTDFIVHMEEHRKVAA